jgi:hypothetical protein
VRRAQADRFFPGEQVVFGEPCRACRGAVGIEDAVDVEQQGGARQLSSMDAASRELPAEGIGSLLAVLV